MTVLALSLYRPVWELGGARVTGPDEDVLTMAVAAARPLIAVGPAVRKVVLVTPRPDIVEGFGGGVLARALDLGPDAVVQLRIGGAPAVLDALLENEPGTVVAGVDLSSTAASAGAALLGDGSGLDLVAAGRISGSLPMRVGQAGHATTAVYRDARVERELAAAPLVAALRDGAAPLLAGIAAGGARRLGARPSAVPTPGAASVCYALAELASAGEDARLVAVDGGSGSAADVRGAARARVLREERPAIGGEQRPRPGGDHVEVPFSMPAYARAFEAKVGLVAAACACGEISYPPRDMCLRCDRYRETTPVALPRTGEVYTCVTVHVPIPGIPGPYALAIVSLDGSPVRVLAQVADTPATATRIGDRGRLVLRRVALREGVPDYGYAFQGDTTAEAVRA
ncbi:Zn-ribbon domain-containing OB-fold protein [Acrocarpospora catenulata]|uniref:Zn-ribbon domain-containing OB-fold protein n=1 Tax=Acrocarpospora catenulata TaxID=2836182 RepID=UPI001BD9D68C|nr:OB-fold domain-containing protein [Acrocarpospora catenulata]